jgi:hypothetical protein
MTPRDKEKGIFTLFGIVGGGLVGFAVAPLLGFAVAPSAPVESRVVAFVFGVGLLGIYSLD